MTTERELARLIEVMDAYGADPMRWPETERVALEPLFNQLRNGVLGASTATGSFDARLLTAFEDARALDAGLAMIAGSEASSPSPDAVSQRIASQALARVMRRPETVMASGVTPVASESVSGSGKTNVVVLRPDVQSASADVPLADSSSTRRVAKVSNPRRARNHQPLGAMQWGAAGAMAASLMLGVALGATGVGQSALDPLVQISGLEQPIEADTLGNYDFGSALDVTEDFL